MTLNPNDEPATQADNLTEQDVDAFASEIERRKANGEYYDGAACPERDEAREFASNALSKINSDFYKVEEVK
jgi:hypothetical protein